MSRRRLERGFWKGRQVGITEKEHSRIYVWRQERGSYFHRHALMISMDWPWPDEFTLDHRLPRKTKKAIWKQFNGHPNMNPRSGVRAYNGSTWAICWSVPVRIHNGRKP